MEYNTALKRAKEFLCTVHSDSEPILNAFLAETQIKAFPKGHVITYAGEVQRFAYIIIEGFQKIYCETDRGERIIAFTYPISFSGIPDSFLTQTPSRYFLKALSPTVLLQIEYHKTQDWMQKERAIESLFRKAMEQMFIGLLQQFHELSVLNMQERYEAFMVRSGQLLQYVTQKDIASYLHIDPTNFSKLINSIKS